MKNNFVGEEVQKRLENPIDKVSHSESGKGVSRKEIFYERVRRFQNSKIDGPPYNTLAPDEETREVPYLGGKIYDL